MRRYLHLLLALPLSLGALVLAGCDPTVGDDDSGSDDDDTSAPDFAIWGPDFISPVPYDHPYEDECEQALPAENSCLQPNPEILWEGVPEGTESLALIFDDISFQNYPHWAIFNIPPDAEGLEAAISGSGSGGSIPDGATELENGFGEDGYLGSCPGGINHYRWRLWALPEMLDADLYTTLGTQAGYAELAADADAMEIDEVRMCHVFRGSDAPNR